jgi:hypothetical protein
LRISLFAFSLSFLFFSIMRNLTQGGDNLLFITIQ